MKKIVLLSLLILGLIPLCTAQFNVSLRSITTYSVDLNDIWGYAADGNEYALVGLRNGVNILDITDPDNPVDLGTAPGPNSTWRDIKTFGEYAYATNENNDGILVIDLSNLPTPLTVDDYSYWEPTIPNLGTISECHNLYIDETGYIYLAGCNVNAGGPLYVDVFTTPGSPVYVDKGPAVYAHDVYTRNDIMYVSHIFAGDLRIYDVSDKSNTILEGSQTTPFDFTHNAWPNDGEDVVFTTDEKANATVAAYDVSDPTDIELLDEFKPLATLNTGVIPHNVHVYDDYLVISHYSDGVVIVDASEPDNLIEVGQYDTYTGSGTGFNGAWGAYPFLPSGNILVSDQDNGCFVLTPTYLRAARLEGTITDVNSGNTLFDVDISIAAAQANQGKSNLSGVYKTGLATAGTYDVTYSKAGYQPQTLSVTLTNGVITIQDVQLGEVSLPVELTHFSARRSGKQALLNWTALSDASSLQFTIERSSDGINFAAIGQLEDRNPSLLAQDYVFTDPDLPGGTSFYRLLITEPDGQFRYSPIRAVDHPGAEALRVQLFPNPVPAGTPLQIRNLDQLPAGDKTLQLFDAYGRLVDQQVISTAQQITYDSRALSSGLYLLNIQQGTQVLQSEQLLVE
ncbi:MAG: choice-of-anchor B family protein [Bacteroidota bacterium]